MKEVATGETPDLCILLFFVFWDIVHCARHANKQPGSQKGQEIRGRFVGFAWDVGHKLTFLVLADDTQKVIKQSVPRLADCPENEMRLDENNLRLDKAAGKELRRKANFKTAGRDPCLVVAVRVTSPSSSAVARQRFKVLEGQANSEFPRKISLKDFSKVGESVVRHGQSQPLKVEFDFDSFDD